MLWLVLMLDRKVNVAVWCEYGMAEIECTYCGYSGGGSHYHCGRCKGVSSMMGHYMSLDNNYAGAQWKKDLVTRLGITLPWTGFTCDPRNEMEELDEENLLDSSQGVDAASIRHGDRPVNEPIYTEIGSLDYGDMYGGLVRVFSCSQCFALVARTDDHTVWHKNQEVRHVFGGLV